MVLTTINYSGGVPIVPDFAEVRSAAFRAESRTVVHDILDGPPVYTLRPGQPRNGTLRLIFADAREAAECERIHLLPSTFTITSAEVATLNFTYVTKTVALTLDEQTSTAWVVEVGYQAVI